MIEIRLAEKGEIERQKELWKLCFGDDPKYIDFYFANKYQEEETLLLLYNKEIIAILTMMPLWTVFPDGLSFASSMLYAIGTHPGYRHKGFSSGLMRAAEKLLVQNHVDFTLLVPAGKQLFDFYYKQGYRECFYLRESILTREAIEHLPPALSCECNISSLGGLEYNQIRNNLLKGRLFTAYTDEQIEYQKKLSLRSGADLYSIDLMGKVGCAVIERRNTQRMVIKELIIPEAYYPPVLKQISKSLPAEEYLIRTPIDLGENLGGTIRPFGMMKAQRGFDLDILAKEQGYLGIAFD